MPLTYVLADRTAADETHHVETTLELVAVGVDTLGRPLLGLGVEVVVSPQLGHELVLRDTELLGVTGGELTEGEGPSVETGTERDGALLGVDLAVAEGLLVVHRDDDVASEQLAEMDKAVPVDRVADDEDGWRVRSSFPQERDRIFATARGGGRRQRVGSDLAVLFRKDIGLILRR